MRNRVSRGGPRDRAHWLLSNGAGGAAHLISCGAQAGNASTEPPRGGIVPVMSTADAEVVRRAYDALANGRLEELEQFLHPDAQWLGVERGPWDCIGREQVLATLRERLQQNAVGELDEIRDVGDAVLVTLIAAPDVVELLDLPSNRSSILVECNEGQVVRMRDFASSADALAAAGAGDRDG